MKNEGEATYGLGLRALALPTLSQVFVARVYYRALINKRRYCIPDLS